MVKKVGIMIEKNLYNAFSTIIDAMKHINFAGVYI